MLECSVSVIFVPLPADTTPVKNDHRHEMELTLLVIATFLLSAAAGWLTIPRIVMISKKKKLFDELSARKSHTGAVPRLGGVSFLPACLFPFSLA